MNKLAVSLVLVTSLFLLSCGSEDSFGPPPSMEAIAEKSAEAIKDNDGNLRANLEVTYDYDTEDYQDSKSIQVESTATDYRNANLRLSLDNSEFLHLISTSEGKRVKECDDGTPKTDENNCDPKCKDFDYERNYAPSSDYCVDKEGTAYRFYFRWNKDFPAFKNTGIESVWEYLDYVIEEKEVIDDIIENSTGGMSPELRKAVVFSSVNSVDDFKKDLPDDFLAGLEGIRDAVYKTATVESARTEDGREAWKVVFHLSDALSAASLDPEVTGMVRKYYTESDDPLSMNNLDGIKLFLDSTEANAFFDKETYLPLEANFDVKLEGKALENFASEESDGSVAFGIHYDADDYGQVSTEELDIPDDANQIELNRESESGIATEAISKEIFGPDWGR